MAMPRYAENAIMSQGQGGGGGLGSMLGSGGFEKLFSGLFGDSGSPYGDASKQYEKYFNEAKSYQNPFYNAGVNALNPYQDMLKRMSDPSKFINGLTDQYQESPWAHALQQRSEQAGMNAASASGLSGSTPFMMSSQQNAKDIASQDMNSWMQNVLGVNTQALGGYNNLIQGGQHSADVMSQLSQWMGNNMGDAAYGQRAGQIQDRTNTASGAFDIGKLFMLGR